MTPLVFFLPYLQGKFLGVWVAGEENLLELDLRKNLYSMRGEMDASGSHLGEFVWCVSE